jgi:hypothetical protein
MVSMAEKSIIMLKKLKHNPLFLDSQLLNFGNKSLLNKFYKRMKWVPLGGTNFNDINSLI